MTKERKAGAYILVSGLLLFLIGMIAFIAHNANTLHITIVFKDAKGLKAGDSVQISGVDIGVVKWVELVQSGKVEVKVEIHPEHTELVRQGDTAIISNVVFPNVSGQKILELINSYSSPRMPGMKSNETIKGMNSRLELVAWKTRGKIGGGMIEKDKETGPLVRKIKNFMNSVKDLSILPEHREFLKKLAAFIDTMKEEGAGALGDLRKEWPALKESFQPVFRELKEYGQGQLVEEIKNLMHNIDRTLDMWEKYLDEVGNHQDSPTSKILSLLAPPRRTGAGSEHFSKTILGIHEIELTG